MFYTYSFSPTFSVLFFPFTFLFSIVHCFRHSLTPSLFQSVFQFQPAWIFCTYVVVSFHTHVFLPFSMCVVVRIFFLYASCSPLVFVARIFLFLVEACACFCSPFLSCFYLSTFPFLLLYLPSSRYCRYCTIFSIVLSLYFL